MVGQTSGEGCTALEVISGHFLPYFDFGPFMKIVCRVEWVLNVKFSDHQKWLKLEVRAVHAPPLMMTHPASFGGVDCMLGCIFYYEHINIYFGWI